MTGKQFYVGHAEADGVAGTAWFIGQFVPPDAGLRHQTDVEVKWGVHRDGERRTEPWATGTATTISVLIHGSLRLEFGVGDNVEVKILDKLGDYVIFGPETVHCWEAIGDCVVLSIRFPSIELKHETRRRE